MTIRSANLKYTMVLKPSKMSYVARYLCLHLLATYPVTLNTIGFGGSISVKLLNLNLLAIVWIIYCAELQYNWLLQ